MWARPASRAASPPVCRRSWYSSRPPRTPSSSVSTRTRAPEPCRRSCTSCCSARSNWRPLKQADLFAPTRVADYLFEKDRLFARVTLDDAEYALYEQLYARLDIQVPKPDLVVYLQAPVDVLQERILRRGVDYEQYIERQYLERLNEAYARFFHEFDAAPLLIVNAAAIDPIANQRDYDELLAAIKRMTRGRLYYNPSRSRAI